MEAPDHPSVAHRRALEPGTSVEVLNGLGTGWTRGFEVAAERDGGYLLKRLSDGSVLPGLFDPDVLRPRFGRGPRRGRRS